MTESDAGVAGCELACGTVAGGFVVWLAAGMAEALPGVSTCATAPTAPPSANVATQLSANRKRLLRTGLSQPLNAVFPSTIKIDHAPIRLQSYQSAVLAACL